MESINVHIPCRHIAQFLPLALERGLAPELYFEGDELARVKTAELEKIASRIASSGLRPSMHAPFMDINLAAADPDIAEISRSRVLRSLEFARILNATGIVIHPGYDPFRFLGAEDRWLANITRNIGLIVSTAEKNKIFVAVENIFEESFTNLKKLFNHFKSPWLGHCFDTGHFNIFVKTPLDQWLSEMGGHTFALHIHDNFGAVDEHLPVGDGSFPFDFFAKNLPSGIRWTTMEMHDEGNAEKCLRNWRALKG